MNRVWSDRQIILQTGHLVEQGYTEEVVEDVVRVRVVMLRRVVVRDELCLNSFAVTRGAGL